MTVSNSGFRSFDRQSFWLDRNLRQAEVENFGVSPLGDKDVRRLNVTMNNSTSVRRVQCISDLDRHSEQRFNV